MRTSSDVSKILGAFLRKVCETENKSVIDEACDKVEKHVDVWAKEHPSNAFYLSTLDFKLSPNLESLYVWLLAQIGEHLSREEKDKNFFHDISNFAEICRANGANSLKAITEAKNFIESRNIKSLLKDINSPLDIILIATQKHNGYLIAK